jgi:hypothetical protein
VVDLNRIPDELKARRQWVLWRYEHRDGDHQTKVPKRTSGRNASVKDADTWAEFHHVVATYERGGFDGIGYVFTREDPYVGIDLDGCIAADGTLQTWGREWVDQIATYCEVSPSGTGLKLIARAVPPGRTGGKANVPGVESVAAKVPGIEFFAERRFFALTGQVWDGFGAIADAQKAVDALWQRIQELKTTRTRRTRAAEGADASSSGREALVRAATRYVERVNGASQGERNSTAFNLAGHLLAFVIQKTGERLSEIDVLRLLQLHWNSHNSPPLPDDELHAAIHSAAINGTPRKPKLIKDPSRRRRTTGRSTPDAGAAVTDGAPRAAPIQGPLPGLTLPGGEQRICDAAQAIGEHLKASGRCFIRGGAVMLLERDEHGCAALSPVKPTEFASLIESVVRLVDQNGQPATCSEAKARLLMGAESLRATLPVIKALCRCPVLVSDQGALRLVNGYDARSGILAQEASLPTLTIIEAVELLSELLVDFCFVTPSDRSRAHAALVTPGLVFGGLLKGRAPIDLGEADRSQAGKGVRNKITAAIYNDRVLTVTQRKGGVGSMEEAFSAALIRGAPFISLDNVRGRLDSQTIESFVTEDRYLARIPYSGQIEIDPSRIVLMLTSNRAELTEDFANRSSIVRIAKQPAGYVFQRFGTGDVIEHVRANWPTYLGAVHAVIRHWHDAGRPVLPGTTHDFRAWAGPLDWIVQQVFGAAPLTEGHREAQRRTSTPGMTWLRGVALAVEEAGHLGTWLRAHDLLDIIADREDIDLPGLHEGESLDVGDARERAFRGIGRRLKPLFDDGDEVTIDRFTIRRRDAIDEHGRSTKEYRVSAIVRHGPAIAPAFPPSSAIPAIVSKHFSGGQGDSDGEVKDDENCLRSDGGYGGRWRKSGWSPPSNGGNEAPELSTTASWCTDDGVSFSADGAGYPPPGAELPATHRLAALPVVCRVHLSDEHDEGFRHEILKCRQPASDGLVGWAVISDQCYLEIVRERGEVRTLSIPAPFTSAQLQELHR